MQKNDNYRDFNNRKPYNNIPCECDEDLFPVVLSYEMKKSLGPNGYDKNNVETWHFPNASEAVPIIFVPHKKGNAKAYMKFFNKEVQRYLQHYDFKEKNKISLDRLIDDIADDDEFGYDPTGTTFYEDSALLILTLDSLISDVESIDPKIGKIIRLLYQGYSKGEIIQILKLQKGKTQSYAFIEKAQKVALEIYNEFYR